MYSLYVGHLPSSATKEKLTELFSVCGEVKDVYIHPFHDKPFGYGFVRFSEAECVLKAAQEAGEWMMGGVVLKVELSAHSREVLKSVMAAKRTSARAVMKDNNVRARVKEACHSINKVLDIVHDDKPLDSTWVLNRIEDMSLGYGPRLTGSPSNSAISTLETLQAKICRTHADSKDPAENGSTHCPIKENLKSLLSSVEMHHRSKLVTPPPRLGVASRPLWNGPEHLLKRLAGLELNSVGSSNESHTTSSLCSVSSSGSSSESEPVANQSSCANCTFQNKRTEWQHSSGIHVNKSFLQTRSPSNPGMNFVLSSKEQKVGVGGAHFQDSNNGFVLNEEKANFVSDSQDQSRPAIQQLVNGHSLKVSVTETDSVDSGNKSLVLYEEQKKDVCSSLYQSRRGDELSADSHQPKMLMTKADSQQSVGVQDSSSVHSPHVQNYSSTSVARLGRGRKLLDKLQAMTLEGKAKETPKNYLEWEMRASRVACGRGAILRSNFDN